MKTLSRIVCVCLLAGLLLPLSAATIIDISRVSGVFEPGSSSVTEVNFENLSITGSSFSVDGGSTNGVATYSWAGSVSPVVSGSQSGAYASPVNDDTKYLTVGSPDGRPESVTIDFSIAIRYFGLYLTSPDSYNYITFISTSGSTTTFSGAEMWGGTVSGDTSQGSYLNFTVEGSGDAISQIILSSTSAAFESDNHAFAASAPSEAPEPSTLFSLGIGLALVGCGFRKGRRA